MSSHGSNSYGRTVRFQAVEHPAGTRVAQPPVDWACWACVEKLRTIRLRAPRSCSQRARKGFCTCPSHRRSEAEAQALKAALKGAEIANTEKGRAGARGGK